MRPDDFDPLSKEFPVKYCLVLASLALLTAVPASAANVTATISSTFNPVSVTLVAGDSVTWNNVGGGFHNVVADDVSFRCSNGCDDEIGGDGDASTADWSFSRFFATSGTVAYHCEIHGAGGMSGTIIVLPFTIFSDGFNSGNTSGWSVTTP